MFLKDHWDCLYRETDRLCRNSLQLTLMHCPQLSHSTDRGCILGTGECARFNEYKPQDWESVKQLTRILKLFHYRKFRPDGLSKVFPLGGQDVLPRKYWLCTGDPRKLIDSVLAELVKSAESRAKAQIQLQLRGICMDGYRFKAWFDRRLLIWLAWLLWLNTLENPVSHNDSEQEKGFDCLGRRDNSW